MSSKFCLVTGCCGLIGLAIVHDLMDSGYHVIGVDIDNSALDKLHASSKHKSFTPLCADLTDDNSFGILGDLLSSFDHPITSAVHAAYPRSAGWGKPLSKLQASDLSFDLMSQLGCAILFSRFILNYFVKNGGGSLIHISSIQGISAPKFEHYEGLPMTSPVEYSAIKAGVISITRWFAKYYTSSHVRVNCVSPGGVLAGQDPLFLQRYRTSCSNKGMLDPSDVSSMVKYLLSEEAFAINGQNFIIDDGWSL